MAGALVAVLVAGRGGASSGWVIDQAVKGGGDGRQHVVVQSNRMETVGLEPDGTPRAAFIVPL